MGRIAGQAMGLGPLGSEKAASLVPLATPPAWQGPWPGVWLRLWLGLCTVSVAGWTARPCPAQLPGGPSAESGAEALGEQPAVRRLLAGRFRWRVGPPLLEVIADRLPPTAADAPWLAVKDPSVVHHEGRWHLFCSLRKRTTGNDRIGIGYLSFTRWEDAPAARWRLLRLAAGYHAAPQIFYFRPHRKWYLIYQAADPDRGLAYGPCYSTNDDLSDAGGWTPPAPLYTVPPGIKAGLDYWVICDKERAWLFYTSLDGRMWRVETALAGFPQSGWTRPQVVLQADIFEAGHIYRLRGLQRYLALIEAQDGGRRYYQAFAANRLGGEWKPLAVGRSSPFASPRNVANQAESWTTSYSHGELLRAGVDERLEVDPRNLQFLFQGVSDRDRDGRPYGEIPWRLGLLRLTDD